MKKLNNWYVGFLSGDDVYQPPELRSTALFGTVTGHPDFKDGAEIQLSKVIGKDANNNLLTISGSVYELGEPLPNYEQCNPNSKERLLNNLLVKEI